MSEIELLEDDKLEKVAGGDWDDDDDDRKDLVKRVKGTDEACNFYEYDPTSGNEWAVCGHCVYYKWYYNGFHKENLGFYCTNQKCKK